jgi:hypothetical protein
VIVLVKMVEDNTDDSCCRISCFIKIKGMKIDRVAEEPCCLVSKMLLRNILFEVNTDVT